MAGRDCTTLMVVLVALAPVCSCSWLPPPPKVPLPGNVLLPLRKLSQLSQSPCLIAFGPAKHVCQLDQPDAAERLCKPNTTCSHAWASMMASCTSTDILPIGDNETMVPAKPALESMSAMYCDRCLLSFKEMEPICGDFSQLCTTGSQCNQSAQNVTRLCADSSSSYFDNETGTHKSVSQEVRKMTSMCAPCMSAYRSVEPMCGDWSQLCTNGSTCSRTVQHAMGACLEGDSFYFDEKTQTEKSVLRQLQGLTAHCSPCMQAYRSVEPECGDYSQLCTNGSTCSMMVQHAMEVCRESDSFYFDEKTQTDKSVLRQLQGVTAHCSPCMQAYRPLEPSCGGNWSQMCTPGSTCHATVQHAMGVCAAGDSHYFDNETDTYMSVSQQLHRITSMCSPCFSFFHSLQHTCGDWSQLCTPGSACHTSVHAAMGLCANSNSSFFDDKTGRYESVEWTLRMTASKCTACDSAVEGFRRQCMVPWSTNPQGHCDQSTPCGGAFNYALSTCYAVAGMESPVPSIPMPTPPTATTTMAPRLLAECIDDPEGRVAADPTKSCDNLGSSGAWSCDHYDPDFNGVPFYIWQLCPRTCNRCGQNATLPTPTAAPPSGGHDSTKCREHQYHSWDPDCCGYHYATWCADGYIKVHSFAGGEHDCWPGRKGYRCYRPSMDVMNAQNLTYLKATCNTQPRCAMLSREKAERLRAVRCNP